MTKLEATLQLTDNAIAQAYILRDQHDQKSLRIYIEGKGCDGFTYGVAFSEETPNDIKLMFGDLSVICDRDSYRFLQGSSIEWIDDERGKGFLVNNPNHRKFRGKFFKRKNWEERLT